MKINVAVLLTCIILSVVGCGNSQNNETLIVASERGDCVGVAPMRCLLVKKEGDNNWQYLYQEIEGFNYEPGYEYKIEVAQEEVQNPAADQSTVRYILKKEVSKVRKTSENLPAR